MSFFKPREQLVFATQKAFRMLIFDFQYHKQNKNKQLSLINHYKYVHWGISINLKGVTYFDLKVEHIQRSVQFFNWDDE